MALAPHTYVAVVDDDESARRSMIRMLTAAHFQSIAYASVEDYLADWKRPTYDVLVIDLQLGGMGGIQLQQRLAPSPESPAVIFVTARDDPRTKEEALASKCTGYFRKVDAGQEIIDLIRRIAEEREGRHNAS